MVGGAIDGPRPGGNRPMRAVHMGPPVRTRRMRPRKPLMKKQLNKQPLKPPEEQVIQQPPDGLRSLRRTGAAGFPEIGGNRSGRTTPPSRCRATSLPILIRTSRTRRQGVMFTPAQCQAPVALAALPRALPRVRAALEAVVAEAAAEAPGTTTMPGGTSAVAEKAQDVERYLIKHIAKKEHRLGDLYKPKLPERNGRRMLRRRARTSR